MQQPDVNQLDDDIYDEEEQILNQSAPVVSPDDTQLQISCEVGTVSLSLAQLTALRIGDAVEFIRWPGKVRLRVNGLVFAYGYLVEINGMLGVKISDTVSKLRD